MYDKIFVIGFNKCATSTLHSLFEENKLKSCHRKSKYWDPNKYDCFSDMASGCKLWKDFDIQYPNSTFILNTRALDRWLMSRFKQGLRKSKRYSGNPNWAWPCTIELAIEWINQRERDYLDILEYFENERNKLIIVSIEENNWIKYISDQLGLKHSKIKSRNVNKSTSQIKEILDCVSSAFELLDYDSEKQHEILLSNKNYSYKYLQLYKNNITNYL